MTTQIQEESPSLQQCQLHSAEIETELRKLGVSFEGSTLRVSHKATLITDGETEQLRRDLTMLRELLLTVIDNFIREHKSGYLDGPFHRFFAPYYRFWDEIASEQHPNAAINLMRFDLACQPDGKWQVLENNTACPGGTIHCAYIRDAWLRTREGTRIAKRLDLREFEVDSPNGFVQHLARHALSISERNPNIAILSYQGNYTNEVGSLIKRHRKLKEEGHIRGEIIAADASELYVVGERAFVNGIPVALVYNKLDPLQMTRDHADLRGWFDAKNLEGVGFVNSLGAMILSESKRSLAFLSDPAWSCHLDIGKQQQAAIDRLVPWTRLAADVPPDEAPSPSSRDHFVLKADCLTRGEGVFVGSELTAEQWETAWDTTLEHHGVLQARVDIPKRVVGRFAQDNPVLVDHEEYWGIDAFFFGGNFAGFVGRANDDVICNVGNGGAETPVLVVRELPIGSRS